jgi:hypothetical protein
VPVDYARGRDQTIDGLANSAALVTESSEIHGGSHRQILAAGTKHLKFPEFTPDLRECFVAANTLKDFTENEVR